MPITRAAIDLLEILPANHPGRADLINMVKHLAVGHTRFQDQATGRGGAKSYQGGIKVGNADSYYARPRNTNDFHGLGAFLIGTNKRLGPAGFSAL